MGANLRGRRLPLYLVARTLLKSTAGGEQFGRDTPRERRV